MSKEYELTDEQMAEVQGDKERCLAVIQAFDTCERCSANCRKVANKATAEALRLATPDIQRAERERIGKEIIEKFINDNDSEWEGLYQYAHKLEKGQALGGDKG